MKLSIINKLEILRKRFKKIELLLNNNNYMSNKDYFYNLSKEYSKLLKINNYYKQWKKLKKNINNTQKLLEDSEFQDIAKEDLIINNYKLKILQKKLKKLILPKKQNTNYGCILEIRAGTGGNEAALFAYDLFRMYTIFSENRNWIIKIISTSEGEYGGFKEIIIKINNPDSYNMLKFESGGHRVQRIPKTESQGRIHTSTCTVAVIPLTSKKILSKININDLRIDTFRSSGAGGQHVNTTDSAIRITHIPTGLVVECQEERSQHKNKAKALEVLKKRLYKAEIKKKQEKESIIRKNLLGTGDRSDRIRTYNFPQGRVTDHRINLTLYKLEEIIKGKLDILIKYIIKKYELNKIKNLNK